MMKASFAAADRPAATAAADKPTVLQVLHSLAVGGAEMLAARLARNLSPQFRFVFTCLDELGTLGEQLRGDGYTVEVLGRRTGIDLACVRRLASFAREIDASLIHAHQYTPFFYCRAPGTLLSRPPVLFNEHGRFHPDLPSRKRMIFNRLFLRRTDRVVAVGSSVKQALIDNEGIPADRIEVIHNGVPLSAFSADDAARARLRNELGIGLHDPLAIQVARLDSLKDHCTAVRTAERIIREVPTFKLLVVGEGPERAKIEAEINCRGMQAHIRLLGLRTDVKQLLSAADLFLLTSISEGIPVTFIEAMATGLPIVSTDVGGVKEVVMDGRTGLLAPSGDDGALAAAVARLILDPALRRQLGAQAQARANEMFSEEMMHGRYVSLYRQMIQWPVAAVG